MTILTSQSLSDTFVLIFYAQYLIFREQSLKVILSCHLWESIEIPVSFYAFWGESCFTQISILKRYNNFKCAFRQHRKLFTQSTPKFRKVTVTRYEFGIKHWLTLKINQFIFKRQLEKASLCPDKIHTFSYMFQNYFQGFRKALTCQCKLSRNVRCLFVH